MMLAAGAGVNRGSGEAIRANLPDGKKRWDPQCHFGEEEGKEVRTRLRQVAAKTQRLSRRVIVDGDLSVSALCEIVT